MGAGREQLPRGSRHFSLTGMASVQMGVDLPQLASRTLSIGDGHHRETHLLTIKVTHDEPFPDAFEPVPRSSCCRIRLRA